MIIRADGKGRLWGYEWMHIWSGDRFQERRSKEPIMLMMRGRHSRVQTIADGSIKIRVFDHIEADVFKTKPEIDVHY